MFSTSIAHDDGVCPPVWDIILGRGGDGMILERARFDVARYGKIMSEKGLVTGTGGNLSIREGDLVAISPSAVDYSLIMPEDVVVTDMKGVVVEGRLKPSSEIPLHLAVYGSRQDVLSVVHTHSPKACVMACLGWEIPVFHYLVALAGKKVPVAPYALFGTDGLARNVVDSLGEEKAVLMANHGLLAVGKDLPEAFRLAETVEVVAGIYASVKSLGEPKLLTEAETEALARAFAEYDSVSRGNKPGRI